MSGSLCCSQTPPFLSRSKPRKDAYVIAWKLCLVVNARFIVALKYTQ